MTVDAGDGRCPHCGTPLESGSCLVRLPGGCETVRLPARCPSEACRRRRDEELLAEAVERGLIDP